MHKHKFVHTLFCSFQKRKNDFFKKEKMKKEKMKKDEKS